MIYRLDRAFLRARRSPFLYRFTLFTRILLAGGFIPTGMVKLLGERFTLITPDHPIGAFFEAMFQTGLYWRFLGLSQVLAGALLLVPRSAHLGAAAFLPIMVNIFVVTVALDFRGTPVIAGMMLLAVLYLCAWDFHRFRPLFTEAPALEAVPRQRLDVYERAGFSVVTLTMLAVLAGTRDLVPRGMTPELLLIGTAAGLFSLLRFVWVHWLRRSGCRIAATS